MKNTLILLAFLLTGLPFVVHAQDYSLNIVAKERSINVYFDYSNNIYAKYRGISFYGLSYGFSDKWNNQHEVVYNLFAFKKEEVALYRNASVSQTELEASIGYQYTQNLLKNKKSKWQPQIGLMWRFSFYYQKSDPINFNRWKFKRYRFKNYFQLVPQITYRANDLLKITLATHINFMGFESLYQRIYDPNLTRKEQGDGVTYSYYGWSKRLQVRLGVGIKF